MFIAPLARLALLGGRASADPTYLPNLVDWGEGSDLGNDGASVASWLNKTGSGLDPAQATGASQPTVKASAINGQKAVQFNGSSQYLTFSGAALDWLKNVGGATIAVVVQMTSLPSVTAGGFFAVSNGTNSNGRANLGLTSGNAGRTSARALDADAGRIISGTTALVVGVPVILVTSIDYTAGTVTFFRNGVSEGTSSGSVTAGNTSNTSAISMSLGAVINGSGVAIQFLPHYMGARALWAGAYNRSQLDPVLRRWAAPSMFGVSLT